MEDSLRKLSDEPEYPGDQVLATIVRVFRILEDFSHIQWAISDFGGRSPVPKPNPMYYVKSLRANLEDIRRNLPPALRESSTFFSRTLFRVFSRRLVSFYFEILLLSPLYFILPTLSFF